MDLRHTKSDHCDGGGSVFNLSELEVVAEPFSDNISFSSSKLDVPLDYSHYLPKAVDFRNKKHGYIKAKSTVNLNDYEGSDSFMHNWWNSAKYMDDSSIESSNESQCDNKDLESVVKKSLEDSSTESETEPYNFPTSRTLVEDKFYEKKKPSYSPWDDNSDSDDSSDLDNNMMIENVIVPTRSEILRDKETNEKYCAYMTQLTESEGFDIDHYPDCIRKITDLYPVPVSRMFYPVEYAHYEDLAKLSLEMFNLNERTGFEVDEVEKVNLADWDEFEWYYITFTVNAKDDLQHIVTGIFQALALGNLGDDDYKEALLCRIKPGSSLHFL